MTKDRQICFCYIPLLYFVSVIFLGQLHTVAPTFEVYRVDEIRPKCHSVSAPICVPPTKVVIPSRRYRRSVSNQNSISILQRKRRDVTKFRTSWRYNATTFPNFANDENPEEVIESLRKLHPMIATSCSEYLNLFLCSVYSPVCTDYGVVPPCRELCEKVEKDCRKTVQDFGIEWPDSIQCSLFPSFGKDDDASNAIEVVGSEMMDGGGGFMIQRMASLTWMGSLAADGKICIPPSEDDVIGPQLKLLSENFHLRPPLRNDSTAVHTKANHQYGLWCPAEMRSPPGQSGYSFLGIENCSPPCPNMYLTNEELSGVRLVILFMSSLCIIVTFFTLCTFLMDVKRFRYPERPIVFYALSYFIVSVIFMVGFILKEDAACNKEVRDVETHDIIQGFTVVKGDHKQACTIIFMVLYYFTVNGTIWWLILTVTWLLAAGFKWGSEAIEQYSMYYHAIAWGIPAIQTLAVVTFNKIEGDNIAGVCFLGLYDSKALRYMVLIPMCVYLFVGITILCTGFCCLNHVRIKLGDNANKKKLSKFMLRIGVFSVMYIVPQILLLIIYGIEDSYRTKWEATWFLKACDDYRVPCPAQDSNVTISAGGGNEQPNVMLFCAKYVMTLIVALPPLFWVASKKTLQSWQSFFGKKCERKERSKNTKIERNHNLSTAPLIHESFSKQNTRMNHAHTEHDDVFLPFNGPHVLRGSSASVAAQARAESERHSRQNSILQHVIQDIQSAIPPPPLEHEEQVVESRNKKQFPEKRRLRDHLTESSSSRITSSMQRQSSSLSSLTSERRRRHRKRRSSRRSSSLNRAEYKLNIAPKAAHSVGSLHGLETAKSSKNSLIEKPRPPPKPRRTSSLRSKIEDRASTSHVETTLVNSIEERYDGNIVEL